MKLKNVLGNVKWKPLLVCVLIPLGVGALAGLLTMGSMETYGELLQPAYAPPGWVFPVVWTILYILMGIASYRIFVSDAPKEKKRNALILYGVQLFFNFMWSLLFFRWSLRLSAFFWLLALWGLVYATIQFFYRVENLAGDLLLPYLLWVTYAAYLNMGVFLMN